MIGYETYGRGSHKVLVLHDWFADHTSYDLVRPFLDPETFTYVFADLRGYGRSKTIPGECTLLEASQDVIALVDRLKWAHFDLVTHSMSGQIGQYVAASHSDRVTKLVAITPVPACGSPAPEDVLAFLSDAALSNDESAIQIVDFMTGGRHGPTFAHEKVALWRRCSIPEARVAYLQMFSQTDISDQVKGCLVPCLIIAGAHDAPAYQSQVFEATLLQWLPHAHLVVCADAGHYPMVEAPAWLAEQIEKFLQR